MAKNPTNSDVNKIDEEYVSFFLFGQFFLLDLDPLPPANLKD